MKAIVQTGYGSADFLQLSEVAKPTPGDDEVLVRVMAASLSAGDYFGMRGSPFPARLSIGFPRPKKDHVVGIDFAGVVEAAGRDVRGLQAGDEVFGECRGACAEYTVAQARRVARKPAGLTFAEAAAVPTSACAALQALRDSGKVKPGQKVLINGASGGVGPFAVQIAKVLGAEVTAVCSGKNAELVRSLGADHVIDYSLEDFTSQGPRYDVILDNVASHSLSATRRALKPEGVLVPSSGHGGMSWLIAAALTAPFVRGQESPLVASTTSDDLATLAELIEAGSVTPYIDRTYRLEDTPDAFRYLDTGHARGKVVIDVGPDHAQR